MLEPIVCKHFVRTGLSFFSSRCSVIKRNRNALTEHYQLTLFAKATRES
jgi:hypothetical protein